MQTEIGKKLFTVDEYYRMVEAGILPEDASTELIGGEIIEVSVMGPRHSAAVARADLILKSAFNAGDSIALLAYPDVMIPVEKLLGPRSAS